MILRCIVGDVGSHMSPKIAQFIAVIFSSVKDIVRCSYEATNLGVVSLDL